MNVVVMETSAWQESWLNREHDMVNIGFFALTGEAGRVLIYWQSSNLFNTATNWDNPKYDQLVDEAMAEIDTETRVRKYQEAQQIILDELVAFPFCQYSILVGTRANVKGLVLDPSFERHLFKNVYFE